MASEDIQNSLCEPPKGMELFWQEYSHSVQQWNKSALYCFYILSNLLFMSPFQKQSVCFFNFQISPQKKKKTKPKLKQKNPNK